MLRSLRGAMLRFIGMTALVLCLIPRGSFTQDQMGWTTPDVPLQTFTVTNTANTGTGSLRQAIADAGASPGADMIVFNIPGGGTQTIALGSRMIAAANEPLIIDGTTQPGYSGIPLVVIDGAGASSGHECLRLQGNSTVKGLAFARCRASAIQLDTAGNNIVTGNYIGVNPANEADATSGNLGNGVNITTANNRVGGTTSAERNIISRNSSGVFVLGTAATGNIVTGNYIGLLSNGTDAARNLITGVTISGAPSNRIGGSAAGERNVISGHTGGNGAGVLIDAAQSSANQVLGNYIGTDVTGTLARGNQFGVRITEGVDSIIGGSTGTSPGGACTGACNLIAASLGTGISVTSISNGATGTVIEGNYVNTDVTGSNLLATSAFLVTSVNIGASNTRLGGSTSAARNVIVNGGTSANNNVSIGTTNLTNVVVTGNYIGTNAAGTSALGMAQAGVSVGANPNITGIRIGGSAAGEGNLISGGNQFGVLIGSSTGTQVLGNFIGTDVTGSIDLGNALDGVLIQGGTDAAIGDGTGTTFAGACTGGCNVISGNDRDGVRIFGTASVGNRIDYNFIGLNAAGTAARKNTGDAVTFFGTQNNILGKPRAGADSVGSRQEEAPPVYCIQSEPNAAGEFGYLQLDRGTGAFTYTNCKDEYQASSPPLQPFQFQTDGSTTDAVSANWGGPTVHAMFDTTANTGWVKAFYMKDPDDWVSRPTEHSFRDTDITNNSCNCLTAGRQIIIGGVKVGVDAPNPGNNNTIRQNIFGMDTTGRNFLGTPNVPIITIAQGSDNFIADNFFAMDDAPFLTNLSGFRNVGSRWDTDAGSTAPVRDVLPLDHLNNGVREPNDAGDADGVQNCPENLKVVRLGNGAIKLTGQLNSLPSTSFDLNLHGINLTANSSHGPAGYAYHFIYIDLPAPAQVNTNAAGSASIDLNFTGLDASYIRTFEYLTASVTAASGPNAGNTSEIAFPVKVPVANVDIDYDGKTDLVDYRPGETSALQSHWYSIRSSNGQVVTHQFGNGGDLPEAGDYLGVGSSGLAVRRPSNNTVYFAGLGGVPSSNFTSIHWGSDGDIPVVGDFDDDDRTDIGVYRPAEGNWYILQSLDATFYAQNFGLPADKPVPADYNGDGRTDIAVYRSGIWYMSVCPLCSLQAVSFGVNADTPVPGDYDGDGSEDPAVFRSGIWYVLGSTAGFSAIQWGLMGDQPLEGDWDGDGKNDPAVFRNGIWYIRRSSDGGVIGIHWGQPGDIPVMTFDDGP